MQESEVSRQKVEWGRQKVDSGSWEGEVLMGFLGIGETFGRDLKIGVRQLGRNPGFAVAALLILGTGIAATTTIFSVAYSVLLRDLGYAESGRLVSITTIQPRLGLPKANAGKADYFDWRERQQIFEDMGLTRAVGNYNLSGAGEPERLLGGRVTASVFPTLRASPLIGRTFRLEEQMNPALASSVVVLSYALWQRRFGGDVSLLGRKIVLNGTPHEVVGIMRPGFEYPRREFELWTPLYFPPDELRERSDYSYLCVARLKPEVSVEQAQANLSGIAADLAQTYVANRDVSVSVTPMLAELTGPVRKSIWVLLGAVGVLFLVGCMNLANLMVARAANRAKEFAVRASLGATRSRLMRQFAAETAPLAIGGGLLGVGLAYVALGVVVRLLPASMPRAGEIGLHMPVLVFSAVAAATAAFAVALAPAFRFRTNVERGPSARGPMRDGLMVVEIACTLLLVIMAGLLMKSFLKLRATPAGFQSEGVLSLHLAVSRAKYGDDRGVARYLGRLVDRVSAIPGVKSAGIVNRLPMGGQQQMGGLRFENVEAQFAADWRSVSPGYFESLGIPLIAGRGFTQQDDAEHPNVGIIDERMAREAFGNRNPIGQRFRIGMSGLPWVEIVGVVGHLRHEGFDQDPRPQVYWPYAQRTQDRMAMAVRVAGDPASFVPAVREAIREVDPDQPLYDVRTMDEVVNSSLAGQRLNAMLIGGFAGIALLLASIGLYGVIAYLTELRQREFGIRMALGSTRPGLLALVLREGMSRAAAGVVLGLGLAAAVTRLMTSMLHGVEALDVTSYAGAAGVMIIVMLVATAIPARRAAGLDPLHALRQD